MPKQTLAIALCRVSSLEQLENNSLNRQRDAVLKAAQKLGVKIADDGWWSGSVSSKKGTNLSRKDLQQMIARCKKDKRISYLIVDQPDRFMRSIDEAAYFEVTFRHLGVTVWYASDPELNEGSLAAKLLKFTKYLSAEGSNDDRILQSIGGATAAIKEGRYPFSPKPGYKRGYERGIQEVHEVRGVILKEILIEVASKRLTPTNALIKLNKSDFMKGRALYKMDKFRKILTDPFYAGIVEINKQVQARNENGLHEPLITKDQHLELVSIMNGKPKTQSGPRKNGNPKYPMSNHITCKLCIDKRYGRFVGYDHGNGKNPNLIYEKYRCRACGRYLERDDLHSQVEAQFQRQVTDDGVEALIEALDIVWKQEEAQIEQMANRLQHKINNINTSIGDQVEAATDPSNASIKEDILAAIGKKKDEVCELEEELLGLTSQALSDKEQFLRFAFGYIDQMGSRFLEITPENRVRCKNILFPDGFFLDEAQKVYTPKISEIYRLGTIKNAQSTSNQALLVRVKGL